MIEITGYKLIKELGKGGMATVYLAIHELLDREVALKVHKFGASDPAFRDSFVKEGQVIAKLEHAHIVKIYDIGTEDHRFYMAMEYIKEGTLKDKLNQSVLSTDEVLTIIDQTAQALFYAHEKGYIHRDVKPANILFRATNDVVLADFGIAKLQGTDSDLTQIGYLSGTPSYMSPEQSMGGEVDDRTDQYSLGVVLYEMLTGRKPFQGENTMAVTYKHAHEEVPKLPLAYSGIQSVLDKALAKDKEDRYVDVMAFSQALKEAFLNEGDDRTVIRPVRQPVIDSGDSGLAPEQVAITEQDSQEGQVKSIQSRPVIKPDVGNSERKSKLIPVLLSLILASVLGGVGYTLFLKGGIGKPEVVKEPKIVKEEPEVVKEEPEAVKEEPEVVKEEPEVVKEEPEVVKEPEVVEEEHKKWKLRLSAKSGKNRVKATYIIKKNKKQLNKTKLKINHTEELLEGNYTVTAVYLDENQSKKIKIMTNDYNHITFKFKSRKKWKLKLSAKSGKNRVKATYIIKKNKNQLKKTKLKINHTEELLEDNYTVTAFYLGDSQSKKIQIRTNNSNQLTFKFKPKPKPQNNVPSQSLLNPNTRIPIPPGFQGVILINGARERGNNRDRHIRSNCRINSKKIRNGGIIEYKDLPNGRHTIACSYNGISCRDTITIQSDYGKVICDFTGNGTKKPSASNQPAVTNKGTLKLLATIDGKDHPTGFIINQGKKRIKIVSGAPAEVVLPPGRYSITASYNGKTIPRGANLKAGKTLSFTFPFKKNKEGSPSRAPSPETEHEQSVDEVSPPLPTKLF